MEDLENHSSKFRAVLEAYNENSKGNKELHGVIQVLTKELETSRETERHLRELQFHKKPELNGSITVMYIKLKDKYNELLKANKTFEQQIIDLENKYILEKTEIVNCYKDKITIYENQLEKQRDHYNLRESKMNNDFQVYQASMALQIDDVESNWRALLADANQKLKDSNNSCNTLRSQVLALSNKISSNNSDAEKRVQELENKLAFTETQLRITQEKLLNNQRTSVRIYESPKAGYYNNTKSACYKLRQDIKMTTNLETFGNNQQSKYEPLNDRQTSSCNNIQTNENVCVVNDNKKGLQKVNLHPLKQFDDKNNIMHGGNKKRKLYNPSNLHYLNDIEMEN